MSESQNLAEGLESADAEGLPDGSEETGLFAEDASPGLDAETPEQQALKAPEQQETEPTQQPIPAKEDESRFEYHQSRADTLQRELEEIKGSQIYTISEHIQRQPELLDIVEDSMRGGQIKQPKGIPERPVQPRRPTNYDASEAHDPETVSGQFRAEFDKYQEDAATYRGAVEDKAVLTNQRNAEKAQLTELKNGLIQEGGLSEVEADDAMKLFNTKASRSGTALAKFYRILRAPSQDEIANREKTKKLLALQDGLKAPPPLATVPGESPAQTTDEEDYMASLEASSGMGGSLL